MIFDPQVEQIAKNQKKKIVHPGPKKDAKKLYPDLPDYGNGSTTTKDHENDNKKYFSACLAVAFVLLLVFVVAGKPALNWLLSPSEEGLEKSFKVKIEELRQRFGNQNEDLWPVIKKLGVDHLIHIHDDSIPDPTRPLVFVFTSILENDKVLMCLVSGIGNAFSSSKDAPEIPVISGNDIANEAHSKEILDERLEGILNSTKHDQGVVIVTELGSLNYETASIFFKYCDNEGAPYPKAVFLFTLSMYMDESFLKQSRREITKATRDHLSSVVWADGDKAKTDALIARIIDPFPFAIMKEDMSVVKNCP